MAVRGNVITIALNMPSGKLKKKDMIKVEGRFLEGDDTNKVSSDCPIIYGEYNQRLQTSRKKSEFHYQIRLSDIFRCSNPDCITNSQEHIESIMEVIDKDTA